MCPISGTASGIGVYPGNDLGNVTRFERWLGCPVRQVLVFTEWRSWNGIADPGWFINRFASVDVPITWSVGMIPPGASLKDSATGKYNDRYLSGARVMARARPDQNGIVHIRVGWELNGDWFPWAAEGREKDFIATYRHIVTIFRSVSGRFRFEWNINWGKTMDPATAYPGDDYVDVIGMDFYWMPRFTGSDPVHAFTRIRDDRYGLQYITNFAKAHGKPLVFSEWGIQGNKAAPFIERVQQWIKANGVVHHNYWDSDADYTGQLSGGRWPRTGAAFRKAFCDSGP